MWIYKKVKEKNKHFTIRQVALSYIVIMLLLFTTFGNWLTEFDVLIKRLPHLYFEPSLTESFSWLKNHTNETDVILSGRFTANFIPGFTGRKVYAGHGVETAYFHCCKASRMRWFFDAHTPDEKRRAWLDHNNITHVLYYPKDYLDYPKKVFNMENAEYLESVFTNKYVWIYHVTDKKP